VSGTPPTAPGRYPCPLESGPASSFTQGADHQAGIDVPGVYLPAVRGGICALPEIHMLQFLEPWDDPHNDLPGTSWAQRVTGSRIAGMSSRRPRFARTQRRADERREAALFRRLHARARELTYEPASLDEALRQEPRLLDAALPGRYAARQALFRGARSCCRRRADWSCR
jgi:hypothetical protein